MKLIRFGEQSNEKPGVLLKGKRKDASAYFQDWDHGFFQQNELSILSMMDLSVLPDVPDEVRWASCIARPGKVICIGLNYLDHATESGMAVPKEPIVFFKAPNATVGPYDAILIPRGSEKTDWEIELGVVIGQDARYLESPTHAREFIAGYCISHDLSERAFQIEHGGQWVKGKSCDTFNPLGPWMLTAEQVQDPQKLNMKLAVNGIEKQAGNTRAMIFGVYELVHYLSQFMTLEAGDLISTGTPPGVGFARTPPEFLHHGDNVSLSITGLGEQQCRCENAS